MQEGECYFLSGDVHPSAGEGLVGSEIDLLGDENERHISSRIVGFGLHKYIGLMDLYQHPTVVIPDDEYQKYIDIMPADVFTGLVFNDDMKAGRTINAIDQIIPERFGYGGFPSNVSYYEVYKAGFRLYGPYVFIGLFIGILFVAAIGSVLYYKMIMEAQEEIPRYQILSNVGMKKSEISNSVFKQLGMVFGIPLLIGLVHTVFALLTYNRMMDLLGQETPTLQNAFVVIYLFVLAYGAFYLLSVKSYCRIVGQRG